MPHTADLRIEAWAPTRNGCIKEAVLGTVESFLDTALAHPKQTRRCRLTKDRNDDLLAAVLEEVVYLLDTEAEVPVDIDLHDLDGDVEVTFAMVDATRLTQVGAVPKAPSLNAIRLSKDGDGWRCLVTLDV